MDSKTPGPNRYLITSKGGIAFNGVSEQQQQNDIVYVTENNRAKICSPALLHPPPGPSSKMMKQDKEMDFMHSICKYDLLIK